MARDTKWCQNPKCPEKKNSNQIRGSKGSKYYQSILLMDMVVVIFAHLVVMIVGLMYIWIEPLTH